jgi:hypothetical protein
MSENAMEILGLTSKEWSRSKSERKGKKVDINSAVDKGPLAPESSPSLRDTEK